MKFEEAITDILNNQKKKFVETVDIAVRLNINPKKQEQNVREIFLLPNPIPKQIKLLVIDDSLSSEEVKSLDIDHYGGVEMIDKIQDGWLDFTLMLTSTKMMPRVLKLGKLLGPKGLMPNAKTGTVTNDIKRSVMEFKKGKSEFKNDSFGNLHISIGKANFEKTKLEENYNYVINLIKSKKPSSITGHNYIKKIYVSSTMSKSYELDYL